MNCRSQDIRWAKNQSCRVQTLTEITKDNARQETTAEVPFSEKIHMGQHKRRTNQF